MSSSLMLYHRLFSPGVVPAGITSRSAAGLSHAPDRGRGTGRWADTLTLICVPEDTRLRDRLPIVGQRGQKGQP